MYLYALALYMSRHGFYVLTSLFSSIRSSICIDVIFLLFITQRKLQLYDHEIGAVTRISWSYNCSLRCVMNWEKDVYTNGWFNAGIATMTLHIESDNAYRYMYDSHVLWLSLFILDSTWYIRHKDVIFTDQLNYL